MNKNRLGLLLLIFILPLFVAMADYGDSSPLSAPVSFNPKVVLQSDGESDPANTEKPRGQMLYENHCRVCHEQSVHVRAGNKAHNKDDIKYWVTRWSTELELNWSNKDINDVVNFLQSTYYKNK